MPLIVLQFVAIKSPEINIAGSAHDSLAAGSDDSHGPARPHGAILTASPGNETVYND